MFQFSFYVLSPEPVPSSLPAGIFVFDALCRAAADACHAVCAVAAPYRLAVYQTDIIERAKVNALAAGDTVFFEMETFVLYDECKENLVYKRAH